jgi:hypothetical protein
MGLFANMISLNNALKVLDRFMMFGEEGILQVVQQAFQEQSKQILAMSDPLDLQIYIARQIYIDAIEVKGMLSQQTRSNFFFF